MMSPEPHCPSYYAATCNDQSQYEPLVGDTTTDVCIVGAGFTGISTALTLAERGYRVTVLEQNRVSWGASGRNGGQMIGGISGEETMLKHWGDSYEQTLFEMGYRGHEIIEERVEKYAIDCDLKYGYIDVALKSSQVRQLHQWYEAYCRLGMSDHLRLVDKTELASVVGTASYHSGLINNRNGHLHPLNLCMGEARAAASLGVEIHEGTHVTNIIHGKKAVVETNSGRVTADFVVLAGNAYHHLEQKSLSGLVFPGGSYILATEPLSPEEVADINPLDLAVCDQNAVLDYYRLSADKRMLFGGRCNFSGRVPHNIAGTMLPRMQRIFPQLADKKVDYAWGGNVGIVVNRVPVLGRVSDNVFYSMGYSGHGVSTTHLCGEIMADTIAGTFEKFDVFAKVPHRRIPMGQWFGSQMVSMGMMYYRLKDLL
ncbi:MAG: gamma-glutamylputrescine oxidase [Halioglobus sp.]|jgi:gamma-glutamylputrescine oxidase